MAKNKLYAHILLDRSGSMETCRDATIDAFNEYVNGLAQDDTISARVSLTTFDSQSTDLIRDNLKAKEMPKLTRNDYVPRGGTPLNDAIGHLVGFIDRQTRREGERVALVILTDGLENASTEFTKPAIKSLLDGRQRDKGWLVIYLGANQDAFAEGVARGMAAHNTMSFDTQNVSATMTSASRATRSYAAAATASLGQLAAGFTDNERKAALKK